jgi:L-ascorbate metabolism protein UlaG (beta-lactamase superfamily)
VPAGRLITTLALLLTFVSARAEIVATYLGNEGVLVTYGDSKILFDPIYRNSYEQYQLVPPAMEQAIFDDEAPFDGVDAVFVSHSHGDHFSAEDMAKLLIKRPALRFYAPAQAVAAMMPFLPDDDAIYARIIGYALEYGDPPIIIGEGPLKISAIRIPHSGWPSAMAEVQNIAFRVTLDSSATVAHFGDADTSDDHYAQNPEYWEDERIDIAFPPYWYFSSAKGRHVLTTRLKPRHSIGVHVPTKMPDIPAQRPAEYRGYDLFTEPGQTRRLDVNK